jgi:hypothetical protein
MNTVALAVMCVALIGCGVVAGFLFALSAIAFHTSALPEYLVLSEPIYGYSESWFAFTVNNTGVGAVTLVKVLVNYVRQTTVDPVLPCTIAPDHGLLLNVTMDLTQNQTYQIDLYTTEGNKFSELSQNPFYYRQAGVVLYIGNIGFYGYGTSTPQISIEIGDSGTQGTVISHLYIGTSDASMQQQTFTPTLASVTNGQLTTITTPYNWTPGAVYFFKIVGQIGAPLGPVSAQAPQPLEQLNITNMNFDVANKIVIVTANNTGTSSVTINEAWVNNVKYTTVNPALPVAILPNNGQIFNITLGSMSNGYSYQVKLVSAKGNAFLYTATAPS